MAFGKTSAFRPRAGRARRRGCRRSHTRRSSHARKPLGFLSASAACSAIWYHRTESPGRDPDAQPAVAEPSGPSNRGIGAAADNDRNPRRRRGKDLRVAQRDELAIKLTGFPSQSPRRIRRDSSIRRPRVLGSTPQISSSCGSSPPMPTPSVSPGGSPAMLRVDVPPTRMTQRKEVKRHVTRQVVIVRQHRGGVDQRVRAGADMEADMVADERGRWPTRRSE